MNEPTWKMSRTNFAFAVYHERFRQEDALLTLQLRAMGTEKLGSTSPTCVKRCVHQANV